MGKKQHEYVIKRLGEIVKKVEGYIEKSSRHSFTGHWEKTLESLKNSIRILETDIRGKK